MARQATAAVSRSDAAALGGARRSPDDPAALFAVGDRGACPGPGARDGGGALRARARCAGADPGADAARRHRDRRPTWPMPQTVEPGRRLFTIGSEAVGDRDGGTRSLGASLSGGQRAPGQRAREVREPAPRRRAGSAAARAAGRGTRVAGGPDRAPGGACAGSGRAPAAQLRRGADRAGSTPPGPSSKPTVSPAEAEQVRADAADTRADAGAACASRWPRDGRLRRDLAQRWTRSSQRARTRKGLLDGEGVARRQARHGRGARAPARS